MKRGAALLLMAAASAAGAGVRLEIGAVVPVLPNGAVSISIGHGHGHGHYWRHGGWWYRPWGAQWVVVPPPAAVYRDRDRDEARPPRSVGPTRPDPVITPLRGQDANQAEFDRQACNRAAVAQPAALADAAEFQRSVARCLDERGYTMQ